MKRLIIIGFALTAGLAIATTEATAAKAPSRASVLIRHQLRGCHSWSVNGNSFKAVQSTRISRGGTITFTNTDVMPHTLIQKSGPAVHFVGNAAMSHMGAAMSHMGATVRVVFSKPGIYRFATKAGEDYMKGIKTVGPDNALRLTVTVT